MEKLAVNDCGTTHWLLRGVVAGGAAFLVSSCAMRIFTGCFVPYSKSQVGGSLVAGMLASLRFGHSPTQKEDPLSPERLEKLVSVLRKCSQEVKCLEEHADSEVIGHGHYAGAVFVHKDFPDLVLKSLGEDGIDRRIANIQKGRDVIEKHKLDLLLVPQARKITLGPDDPFLVQERIQLTPKSEWYFGERYLREAGPANLVEKAVKQLVLYGHHTGYYDFKGDNVWWTADRTKLAIVDHEQDENPGQENFERLVDFAPHSSDLIWKIWQPLSPDLKPMDADRLKVMLSLAKLRAKALAHYNKTGTCASQKIGLSEEQRGRAPDGTSKVVESINKELQSKSGYQSDPAEARFMNVQPSFFTADQATNALEFLDHEGLIVGYVTTIPPGHKDRFPLWEIYA